MPNISGEAFIQLVRAMEPHRRTPILVLSANAERMKGHREVAGVMLKPFTPLSLKQAVERALAPTQA